MKFEDIEKAVFIDPVMNTGLAAILNRALENVVIEREAI